MPDEKTPDDVEDDNLPEFDEKPAEVSDKQMEDLSNEQGDQPKNGLRLWDKLPGEIVEKILIYAIKTSNQELDTYHSLLRTCSRFNLIVKKRRHVFFPSV